jgi:hypothetical protein
VAETFLATIPYMASSADLLQDKQLKAVMLMRALVQSIDRQAGAAPPRRLLNAAADMLSGLGAQRHRKSAWRETVHAASRVRESMLTRPVLKAVAATLFVGAVPLAAAAAVNMAVMVGHNMSKPEKTVNKAVKLLTEMIDKWCRPDSMDDAFVRKVTRSLCSLPQGKHLMQLQAMLLERAKPLQALDVQMQLRKAGRW